MQSPSQDSFAFVDYSDQELLELYFRLQQTGYLEEIVRRYHALVSAVSTRHLNNADDIQDCVQTTFLVLVKSARSIRKANSLGAWLHGVAYRTARRIRQRRSREGEQQLQTPNELAATGEVSPLALLAKQMQLDALEEELNSVRESLRAVLIEHYFLGRTAAEIAERFDLTQSTVEGRLRRGRQLLRIRLLQRGLSFSAAVATTAYSLQASRAAAEITQVVSRVEHSAGEPTSDLSSPISTLVAEEASMLSGISSKLAVGVLLISSTVASLVTGLALSATGQQVEEASTAVISQAPSTPNLPVAQLAGEPGMVAKVASQGNAGTDTPEPPQWLQRTANSVHQTLGKTYEDVNYDATPLAQVLSILSNDFRLPIRLDVNALEEQDIDADSPVTINSPPIPLQQLLNYVLEPLDLSYRIEGDVLLVSTKEKLDLRPTSRVYDLQLFELPSISQWLARRSALMESEHWKSGIWEISDIGQERLIITTSEPIHGEIEVMLRELAQQIGKLPRDSFASSVNSRPRQGTQTEDANSHANDPFGDNGSPAKTTSPFDDNRSLAKIDDPFGDNRTPPKTETPFDDTNSPFDKSSKGNPFAE